MGYWEPVLQFYDYIYFYDHYCNRDFLGVGTDFEMTNFRLDKP